MIFFTCVFCKIPNLNITFCLIHVHIIQTRSQLSLQAVVYYHSIILLICMDNLTVTKIGPITVNSDVIVFLSTIYSMYKNKLTAVTVV